MIDLLKASCTFHSKSGRLLVRLFIATVAFVLVSEPAWAQEQTSAPPTIVPAPPPAALATPATTPTTTVTRAQSPSEELNTLLMHATFLISGPTKVQGQMTFGTVFVIGIPTAANPKIARIALVSAAHVFEGIAGDVAGIQLRRKNDNGTYTAFWFQLPIRKNGEPLYVRHSTADVAAMYADLPDEVPMTGLPPDALMTDKTLEDLEVHPGDDAFVLGFPLAVSGPGGIPDLTCRPHRFVSPDTNGRYEAMGVRS